MTSMTYVERGGCGVHIDTMGRAEHRVVPHVLADARKVGDAGDGELGKVAAVPNAGDHEELRRLKGAGG